MPTVIVFILSIAYWTYLSLATKMILAFDAIGYQELGKLLYTDGWIAYFKTGPNREPLYPFLISIAMHLEQVTGWAYVQFMAIFGMVLMFLTQLLTYLILRHLKVREGICALVLAYLAVSPALNNAAFSLYSEIAAFPLVLGIILFSHAAWKAVTKNDIPRSIAYGALLGFMLLAATLVKAVFECISPAYLLIWAVVSSVNMLRQRSFHIIPLLLGLAAGLAFYYVPITAYKGLNLKYNGHYAVTNRGAWALYGSTARRVEPLTPQRFAAGLAYVPGEGVCASHFSAQDCAFWSFQESDRLGYAKNTEMIGQNLPPEAMNTALLKASVQQALHNPFQYFVLTALEGLKMFFWESTKIGFVEYPAWLEKIYDMKLLNNALRFLMSLLSLAAWIRLWFAPPKSGSMLASFIRWLILLYILFFAFFFILTRYALPLAPLYLIALGLWADQKLASQSKQNKI